MTVRYYSSLDSGAPSLPSATSQRLFDNLRLILLACLVNGYGSKPAAGWTIGHDVTNGFSLVSAGGIINFVHSANGQVILYLMETITDGTTSLAGGYNRRSGPWADGSSVTGRQYVYCPSFYSTTANKQWCVVADDRTVIVQFSGSVTDIDVPSNNGAAIYFGEYQPAFGGTGFCCLAGSMSTNAIGIVFNPNSTSTLPGTVLRNPFDGTVNQGASPGFRGGLAVDSAAGAVTGKSRVAPGQLRPVRASIVGSGAGISGSTSTNAQAHCGVLRGLLGEPALADCLLANVLPALGKSSPTMQDRVLPISMPNGQQWVPFYATTSDLGAFISLDPADWE